MAPVLLLMVTIPLVAADKAKPKKSESSSSRPPRELHLVRGHWTPYNPPDPATYPPNARTHAIKQGETLSGIAKQEYGHANLWPQLWETNTWNTDAHWIYPGDVLLVQGENANAAVTTQTTTTTGTATTAGGTSTGSTTTGGTTTGGLGVSGGMTNRTTQATANTLGSITAAEVHRETSPVPLGAESDVYCYGYIGDPNEAMPNYIESYEDPEVMYKPGDVDQGASGSTGDLIFVTGGTSTGLVAGETYMVIEAGDLVMHPRTGAVIGRHYNYQAQVKILCAEETKSRAVITQSCREVHIGARLKPLPQIPIPIARIPDVPAFCDQPTGRAAGYIISSQDWELALGDGNLVQVNLGQDDQVQAGDFLTVYRDTPGEPRAAIGEIGILTTQSHTATGRIVEMRRAMQVGDSVEAR